MEAPRIDDEHNLIARYAAKLFSYEGKLCEVDLVNGNSSCEGSIDSLQQCTEFKVHQNLIDELEASNRQIMEQISHLKQAEDASYGNSNLIFELQMLKQHKGELEGANEQTSRWAPRFNGSARKINGFAKIQRQF
ncbi:Dyb [Bugula neritina]|uniref:Dyb n=1 Tax=Bugula neritina TaxID=10212 RepID=A0A7J7JG32_BUGNE|nr:Dyb [Bugula neritina]